MDTVQMIAEWLREHGYDGLISPDGDCACEIVDLIPCADDARFCEGGYKVNCTEACRHDEPGEWHMERRKPSEEG